LHRGSSLHNKRPPADAGGLRVGLRGCRRARCQ
jgi:hypothetical protein